jgi:hypothetical protein
MKSILLNLKRTPRGLRVVICFLAVAFLTALYSNEMSYRDKSSYSRSGCSDHSLALTQEYALLEGFEYSFLSDHPLAEKYDKIYSGIKNSCDESFGEIERKRYLDNLAVNTIFKLQMLGLGAFLWNYYVVKDKKVVNI